jgi:Uncharacterized protein conserved in bacteria
MENCLYVENLFMKKSNYFAKSLIFCIFAAELEIGGGGDSPHFCFNRMIEKEVVTRLAEEQLVFSDCYLVDVTIKPGNLIVVEIDHDVAVGIDDCVALSRFIEENMNREVEDYELEVGSSGVGSPLKIVRQYIKYIGNEVEILLKSGVKKKGILIAANESGVTISIERRKNSEGSKRKETVIEDYPYKYDEIKYTKNIIRFK